MYFRGQEVALNGQGTNTAVLTLRTDLLGYRISLSTVKRIIHSAVLRRGNTTSDLLSLPRLEKALPQLRVCEPTQKALDSRLQ